MAFAMLVAASWLASPQRAGAIEHPPIEITEVDPVPERGWGVSDQNPANTQTETLDVLVWDMVQSGDRMFVGGAFLNVKSGRNATPISQPYLAAFDVATGDWVDTFRPTFDRAIYALEVLPNGSVLVGGEFEQVNGTTRRGLVALDAVTGEIDPTFSGAVDRPWSSRRATVRDMKVEAESGLIYVAGSFSHMEGANGSRTTASKAGRFLNENAVLDASWKPTVSGGAVWGLDTDPSRNEVALSGFFTSVNGESQTGNFHVVDASTGATVQGKINVTPNDGGSQPEVFDVVYGEGIVLHVGEQHMIQVLDADDHRLLGYHTTGAGSDGFEWRGGVGGGAFQAGERIGDIIIAGCHCTSGGDNHYESFTDRRVSRYNVMAYDAKTGRHIEEFDADIDSPRDGHWAAATDTAGCLWIGGDYHVGGNEADTPRWVGGFARLCMPVPPLKVANPGDRLDRIGDAVSLQIETTGGRNATLLYSAINLPSGLTIEPFTGLITGQLDELDFDTVTVDVDVIAGEGTPASTTFEWSVMDGVAPVLDPIADRQIIEFAPTEIPLLATDDEGSPLDWSASGLPSGLTIDGATGIITGTPSSEGNYTVAVTATDRLGLSDTETFVLTVIDRPTTPAVSDLRNYSSNTGDDFLGPQFEVDRAMEIAEFGIHDADRDGSIGNDGATTVALYAAADGRELARVNIPAETPLDDHFAYAPLDRPITVQPGVRYVLGGERSGEPFARDGELSFAPGVRIVGYAAKSGSSPGFPSTRRDGDDDRYFGPSFRILGDDPSPTISPIDDQVSPVDDSVLLAPLAASPAGRPLTWTASGLPDGLTIVPTSGIINGSPTRPGTYSVVVNVIDDAGLGDSEAFRWVVADGTPPVIAAIGGKTVAEFQAVSIQARLVDPEPGVTWSATGLPPGLSIDSASGLISGAVAQAGAHTVAVRSTDVVGLTDTETFTLVITERSTTNVVQSHSGFSNRGGDFFLGWAFEVDRVMQIGELGVHDANRDGQITNTGDTTIALYNYDNRQELLRADVPAGTPVVGSYAWTALADAFELQPGTNYILASEVSGENYAQNGSITFVPGVTPTGRGYKWGSAPGFPSLGGNDFQGRYFGPSFRILDPVDEGGGGQPEDDSSLVPAGTAWRYNDTGTDLGDAWSEPGFDVAAWPASRAEFGFGEGDETTTWEGGSVTYYARTDFEFSDDKPPSLKLDLKADDGAVVYLNGVEILRDNMPEGRIDADTPALSWRGGADEDFMTHIVSSAELIDGTNVLAVEVHNVWHNNADLSFDLRLMPFDIEVEAPPLDLVSSGSTWDYTDSANGDPVNWKKGIVGGASGDAEFGFGDGDEATELVAGQEAYYFTRSFEVDDPAVLNRLELGLAADDGAVVYLNGEEVHRFNMPDGPVTATTRPITWKAGNDEKMQTTTLAADALIAGTNVIAVEVHNLWSGNSDLTFDLRLRGQG